MGDANNKLTNTCMEVCVKIKFNFLEQIMNFKINIFSVCIMLWHLKNE